MGNEAVKAYISQPCLTAPLKPHRHLLGSCPHCEITNLRTQLAASKARAERLAGALAELVRLKDIKVRSAECWPDDPEIPVLMREYSTRKGAARIEARAALAKGEAE